MTEDLSAFFVDSSDTLTWNAATFPCLIDAPDELIADGRVVSTDRFVLVKSTDVVGIKPKDNATLNATAMKVRYALAIDDGKLTKVFLSLP